MAFARSTLNSLLPPSSTATGVQKHSIAVRTPSVLKYCVLNCVVSNTSFTCRGNKKKVNPIKTANFWLPETLRVKNLSIREVCWGAFGVQKRSCLDPEALRKNAKNQPASSCKVQETPFTCATKSQRSIMPSAILVAKSWKSAWDIRSGYRWVLCFISCLSCCWLTCCVCCVCYCLLLS